MSTLRIVSASSLLKAQLSHLVQAWVDQHRQLLGSWARPVNIKSTILVLILSSQGQIECYSNKATIQEW
jgi:hypothetical protein